MIYDTFQSLGLTIHVGWENIMSKTEVIFFPSRNTIHKWKRDENKAKETQVIMLNIDGFIKFTDQFTYLDTITSYDLTDNMDIA